MYDDLARTQNPTPLEWFVVNAVIPSVVLSLALWSPSATPAATAAAPLHVGYFCLLRGTVLEEPEPGPIADVFPVLIHMPRASYPVALHQERIAGRVRLKALVNRRGGVEPQSIRVLLATDVRFVEFARRALSGALFRPARLSNRRIDAWITITIDFSPPVR